MKKFIYSVLCIALLCSCSDDTDGELGGGESPNISNYELHYTTRSGYPIDFDNDSFDAPIISNISYYDKCVIQFASPLTAIYTMEGDITSITIPSSVNKFGDNNYSSNPFAGCEYMAKFICKYATADGFALIKDNTLISYARNSRQETFVVPKRVTKIGGSAFSDCQYLRQIKMHDDITTIGSYAFSGCSSLKNITFPKKLKSLQPRVCDGCSELQTVTFSGKLECECGGAPCCSIISYWFTNCEKLEKFIGYNTTDDGRCLVINNILHAFAPAYIEEYSIPNYIEAIACDAFYRNDQIETLYIPSSVKYIGSSAFAYCHNLQDIYCKATNPPVLGWFDTRALIGAASPFYELPYNFKIYVPRASVNSYINDDDWEQFASHIVGYDF